MEERWLGSGRTPRLKGKGAARLSPSFPPSTRCSLEKEQVQPMGGLGKPARRPSGAGAWAAGSKGP